MKKNRTLIRLVAGIAVAAFALAGCRGGGESESTEAGPGITEEACPDAVNEDNGCIYLGTISDLTKGPFAPLAVPITVSQEAFWDRVNAEGGIGGYDINVTEYVGDAEYNPEIHNQKYQEMRDDILALAQTLGSSQTLAILEDMEADDIVGIPASWNSAWDFEDQVLQAGANYCFDAMNSVDWAVAERGVSEKVLSIHFPNDYGGDAAKGVEVAAEANGIEFIAVETPSGQDNQAGAVARILEEQPDLIFITTGPAEMAAILGGAAARGWQGTAIGSSPTWNPALLQTEAAPALEAMYFQSAPWGPFDDDTPGHVAMREALGELENINDGYTAGWVWSYPMLQVLKNAADMDGGITRANVTKATAELESVDFEGMLPDDSLNKKGDPSEVAFRQSVVGAVDPESSTGVSTVKDLGAGPTVSAYEYTEPCFALR